MNDKDYDWIRHRLALALTRDAGLHKLRHYDQIGAGFLETQALLKSGGDHRYQKLIVALNFWDAWILARNTDWLEHDHIPEAQWSSLAKVVAADLEADREITNAGVINAFDLTGTLELPKRMGLEREMTPLDRLDFDPKS